MRNKKTVLITGAAGFIGSHVCRRLLAEGWSVTGIDNFNPYYSVVLKKDRIRPLLPHPQFKMLQADVSDLKRLERILKNERFTHIVHLAAAVGVRHSMEAPLEYEHNNCQGMLSILEYARKHGRPRLLYASSSSVYGSTKAKVFRESRACGEAESVYAATKQVNEQQAAVYHRMYGLNSLGFRFFTVYGPWGRPDMAFFTFAHNIRRGQPIDIYHHGKAERDFTYIDDVVDGIWAALHAEAGFDILNLGSGKCTRVKDMVRFLAAELRGKARLRLRPAPAGDLMHTWASVQKAKRLLGYQPKVDINTGIHHFAEWFETYYPLKASRRKRKQEPKV